MHIINKGTFDSSIMLELGMSFPTFFCLPQFHQEKFWTGVLKDKTFSIDPDGKTSLIHVKRIILI